jgi:hypothetical protein
MRAREFINEQTRQDTQQGRRSKTAKTSYQGSYGAQQISSANQITDLNQIRAGQKLKIPGSEQPYTVKKGDTLDKIAQRYDIYYEPSAAQKMADRIRQEFGIGNAPTTASDRPLSPMTKELIRLMQEPREPSKEFIPPPETMSQDVIIPDQDEGPREIESDVDAEMAEGRKKKRRVKQAAYGPGPYGWYGYDAGYSGDGGGDGGVGESSGDRGDIPTGPNPQLIPFPKGTTMVDVSDVYDWYKLGMVISDLDDADPKIFGQGAPHTVIAFGSEEEESKMLPLLKRLGLKVHDIDDAEDVKQAIPAKAFINDLAETLRTRYTKSI